MFLCAHNQARSVTAEGLLTGEKGYEVRSRALWRDYPRKVTKADGRWADEVYVMMPGMKPVAVEAGVPEQKIKSLWVPDNFMSCERVLIETLKTQLAQFGIHVKKNLAKAEDDCEKVSMRKLGYSKGALSWDWLGSGYSKGVSGYVSRPRSIEKNELKEPSSGFSYVPLWHMQEGERRMREIDENEEDIVERAYKDYRNRFKRVK